jgi:hypothetical protein
VVHEYYFERFCVESVSREISARLRGDSLGRYTFRSVGSIERIWGDIDQADMGDLSRLSDF